MIQKLVTRFILIFSSVAVLNAHGFGIGSIELDSVLNQPMNAKIVLHQVDDYTADDVVAKLASKAAFEKASVERPFFLTSLHFKTVINKGGDSYIQVTSDDSVKEPFVDFLVEVQWPNGQILREFTLLIDPPSQSQDTEISAPEDSVSDATQPMEQQSPEATPVGQPGDAVDTTYQVQAHDHLWQIVENIHAPDKYTHNQVMMAILHKNPEAFGRGNVNQLKAGATLQLPTVREIADIDPQEARTQMIQQHHTWHRQVVDMRTPDKAKAVKVKPEITQDRLKIVGDGSGNQSASKTGNDSVDALAKKLAVGIAENDRLSRENTDLKDHLSEVKKQIKSLEKLVKLQNDQLSQLQMEIDASVRKKQESQENAEGSSVAPPAESSQDSDKKSQESAAVIGKDNPSSPDNTPKGTDAVSADTQLQSTITDNVSDSQLTKTPEKDAVQSASKKNALVITPPPKTDVLTMVLSWFKNPMLLIGMVTVLLIAVLGVTLVRRKRSEEAIEDLDTAEEMANISFNVVNGSDSEKEQASDKKQQSVVTPQDRESAPEMTQIGTVENGVSDNTQTSDDASQSERSTGIDEDSNDVLDEVDVYVSYGRNERAINLLEAELLHRPECASWRLKLLDLLSTSGNQENFNKHYQILQDTFSDQEILREAERLKGQLGDSDTSTPHVPTSDGGQDDDLTLDFSEPSDKQGDDAALDFPEPNDTQDDDATLDFSELEGGDNSLSFSTEDSDGVEIQTDHSIDEPSESDSTELEFFTEDDEMSAKLNLSKAYVDMGNQDGAFAALQQVLADGNDAQKAEAQAMLNALNTDN